MRIRRKNFFLRDFSLEYVEYFCADNPGISCRCGKYLQVFKQLKTLNVTATAVKVFNSVSHGLDTV